jgi:type I restriction enzyme R subunit
VSNRRDLIFSHYDDKQKAFLDFVLGQYIADGGKILDATQLPTLLELKYQGIHDAIDELGDVKSIRDLFVGFQAGLYGESGAA